MVSMVSNLDDKVRESIRGKILAGELESGAHLSELKLSKEFSVSRTPIREALCALAADGLIEMVPHRGAFVRERNDNTIADMQQVYRHLIGLATRFATENAGIETLMAIESAISSMNATTYKTAGNTLVQHIITASGSPMLGEMITTIQKRLGHSNVLEHLKWEDLQSSLNMLLTAFKRRKPDVAEKTMRDILGVQENNKESNATVVASESAKNANLNA